MDPVMRFLVLMFCLGLPVPAWPGQIEYIFSLPDIIGATGSDQQMTLFMDSETGNPLQGWAYCVCHDNSEVTLVGAVEGSTVLTVKNGGPPDFHIVAFYDEGLTVGAVVCFNGCAVLPPGPAHEFLDITYHLDAPPGTLSVVEVCTGIGDPPVQTVLVDDGGQVISPDVIPGSVLILSLPQLVRGDCNQDFQINIADGIFLLGFLFQGGATPSCNEACDTAADGAVELTDAIYVFQYRLLDGPPPPAPFPDCGEVLSDCELSACSS